MNAHKYGATQEKPLLPRRKVFYFRHKKLILISATLVVLILCVFHFLIPPLVRKYAEDTLNKDPEITARIGDVDFHWWAGKFVVLDFFITKKAPGNDPIASVKQIETSIDWRALFRGRILCRIFMDRPVIVIEPPAVKKEENGKEANDWRILVQNLIPIDINSFHVRNGEAQLENINRKDLEVIVTNVNVEVEDIKNTKRVRNLYSPFNVTGVLKEGAPFKVFGSFDWLSNPIAFDVNGELKNVNLPQYNPIFREFGNFDVESGIYSVVFEVASKDQKISGYIKPLVNNLDVLSWKKDSQKGFFAVVSNAVVGAVGAIFENKPTQRDATRIPVYGNLKNMKTSFWEIFITALRNAFVKPLSGDLEGSVNLNSV